MIQETNFISYAIWWIRQQLLESVKDNSTEIRIPQNARNTQAAQDKFVSEYYSKNGYLPSNDEIAEAIATKKEKIILLNNAAFTQSLDEPFY